MIKIAIVGYGYVGRAMHRMLKDRVFAIYDPFKSLQDVDCYDGNQPKMTKEDVNSCDIAIICVPTNMRDGDLGCDLTQVEATMSWLNTPLILMKSTVEVGTTERLIEKYGKHIVFSPEYIGEGKYFTPPWMYPDPENPVSHGFMVLGGSREDSEKVAGIMVKVMGPHTQFVFLTPREAEVVKYMENIWGAMKVTWSNVMKDCCDALGVSYYAVREGWAADPRVERMHTAVFPDARGFSGKCYPKDLMAFIRVVEKAGYNPKLLKEVWNTNVKYRPTEFKEVK